MNKKILYLVAIQFLPVTNHASANGFGWRLTEINYQAVESFFENATTQRKNEVIKELNEFYLSEMVPENEVEWQKAIINKIFKGKINYGLLSFEEASVVDSLIGFLFTAESPLTEFEAEQFGFYVPIYCMQDILGISSAPTEVLHLFKKGRRYGSQQPIECDWEAFELKQLIKELKGKKLTIKQEKKIAAMQAKVKNDNEDPCYYSYIILSPEEVACLASELNDIKDKLDFSNDQDCFFTDFYDVINTSAKKKSGLFLHTTD